MVGELRRSGLCPGKHTTLNQSSRALHIQTERGRLNDDDEERSFGMATLTHSVFEVGYVDVPAQSDKVHVNYPEFGGEEVEVDHLSWRPNTPVSLQEAQFTQLKNPQMH